MRLLLNGISILIFVSGTAWRISPDLSNTALSRKSRRYSFSQKSVRSDRQVELSSAHDSDDEFDWWDDVDCFEDECVDVELPIAPDLTRSFDTSGYQAPAHLRTWAPFEYSSPEARRAAVHSWFLDQNIQKDKAPMKIILLGGPASGKGTIGAMLSQAFRFRVVGAGALLRGEVRARTPRGRKAAAQMARGELLSDELILHTLLDSLDCWDVKRNGFLVDGFPRTLDQAKAVLADDRWAWLRPDAVVVLERPDELMKEFMLGRMADAASGQTYHPTYAPPPQAIQNRVRWRVDDTLEVAEKRIQEYREVEAAIVDEFAANGIPIFKVDNARSEIETFQEIADKISVVQDEQTRVLDRIQGRRETQEIDTGDDVEELQNWERDDHLAECEKYSETGALAEFLQAVRCCNRYNIEDYIPVVIGETQIGWVSQGMLARLRPYMTPDYGYMCRVTYVRPLDLKKTAGNDNTTLAIELVPFANGETERSEVMAELVRALVMDGVIPNASLRRELHDVRPLDAGFVAPGGPSPLMRMERAAKIYFGVPAFGVHVNAYTRDPDDPTNPAPHSVWIATRSNSKVTYPGLFDQAVAGGMTSSRTLLASVRQECVEEASFPPEVIANLRSTGVVSYRYAARKGLSTKRLVSYDVELPLDLSPLCGNNEVEEFNLMTVQDMLHSIKYDLASWKPNSALVAIDFAIRHGFIAPDEPGYMLIAKMLRSS